MESLLTKASALSNANRLQILTWLKDPLLHFTPQYRVDEAEGVCGLYIAEKLGISTATTSAHLKVLVQAGFLRAERNGKFTYFTRIEAAFTTLADEIAAL